ncbi:phage baseplate upper protein [Carnobacterium maltaromaticum]|uniref:phage baseplate upper protein n=1 Tax=Carnobacterium maltaromaticum TaxID=2751 RepID=UPI0039AFDDD1
MIHYPIKLSTTEPNNPIGVVKVRQDDKGTQKLVARITTNSQIQDLTGLEVAFNMRTTEGNVVIEKAVIKDAKLGIIEYVVSGYATQKAGRNTAYFTFFIGEDEQFSTKDFSYFVTNSVTSEGIRGCDYIWKFEDLLEFVTDLANQSQIQLNKLTSDVEVIQKQIDDMFALITSQGVLSADEVRKIMINFLNGEDIEVTIKSDFIGKVAGSIVENGNIFKRNSSIGLQLPSHNTWGENSQAHYDAIKKLDDTVATFSYSSEGAVAAGGTPWNILWALEQNFPSIFKNTTTIAEKVAIAKNKITYLNLNAYGKGSGPNGNKFYLNAFNVASGAWATPVSHALSAISKLTYSYHRPDILLSSEGLINVAMYTDSSNGTVASSVSIDYQNVELRVKFNVSEFVATKAQYEALKSSYTALKLVVDTHIADTVKHITATERITWNAKQDKLFESGLRYPSLGGGAASHATFRVNYEKVGRLVSFGGRALLPAITTTQVQIASVPLVYAPQTQKFYEIPVAGRQTDLFAKIVIDVDGIIYCYFCNSTSQYFVLDGINYLTKD